MYKMEKVSLIGLGAMGAFFAPRLWEALGDNFRIIAGGKRKERLTGRGVTVNGKNYRFPCVTPETQGDPADLIIIAVKSYDLDQAIGDIRNQVGEHTQIMAVLNGVDSEDRLIDAFGAEHVLYSYMRVSIVMKDGIADFNPERGHVYFGEKSNPEYTERVAAVKALMEQAQIPHIILEDMIRGIWFKFMCNVGENLTCALLGIPFGAFRVSEHANVIRETAMWEVVRIARAKGIDLSEADIQKQKPVLLSLPPANKPSTLQDLEAGKITEIELFAGEVIKQGRQYGVSTPVSEFFYHGIRILEEKNSGIIE